MSGFKRRSLSGRGQDGEMRESGKRFYAAGLLVRLADHMSSTREALRWTAKQWSGFMERYQDESKLPLADRKMAGICADSQERIIMETIGVALSLDTSHHPSLLDTTPHLMAWMRDVLGYVVELEVLAESNERTIAGLEKQLGDAGMERLKLSELFGRAEAEIDEVAGRLEEATQHHDRERTLQLSELRDLRRDLAALERVCDAWKVSAERANDIAKAALRRHGVVDLEVVSDDGPQLPARRT